MPEFKAQNDLKTERVTHYAVVITGPSKKKELGPIYWAINESIQKMLTQYGYPDEAVYRFCEQGTPKGPGVDGKSTLANFRTVFGHLAKIMKEDDHLFVFLVGHATRAQDDFVYEFNDDKLTGAEFKALLDAIPTQDVTIALNPCYSGGFIAKLSRPGRVICTSTNDCEDNWAPWAEAFTEALFPPSGKTTRGDARVSIKQAYNAALEKIVEWCRCRGKPQEHPQLDDNGDGVGHFGNADVVDGDGELAARRFLGDDGRKLQLPTSAIENLRQLNATLILE